MLGQDELLKTLRAVRDAGSYTGASELIYMHPRSVRYRVRELQKRHDLPIIKVRRGNRKGDNRHGSGIVLTQYGHKLLGD